MWKTEAALLKGQKTLCISAVKITHFPMHTPKKKPVVATRVRSHVKYVM